MWWVKVSENRVDADSPGRYLTIYQIKSLLVTYTCLANVIVGVAKGLFIDSYGWEVEAFQGPVGSSGWAYTLPGPAMAVPLPSHVKSID